MIGYPKRVATKKDFENLLSMPEFADRAKKDLEKLRDYDDAKAIRVVSGSEETEDLITEEIDNPMPIWKQKGFSSKEEIQEMLNGK